jgi:hypothetical protein
VLASLAAIHWMTCTLGTPRFRRSLSSYRLGSALFALVLAAVGSGLPSLGVVAWAAAACGLQVVFNLFKTKPADQQPRPSS